MAAMENATENAREMIETLQLQYNKARQAAITKELRRSFQAPKPEASEAGRPIGRLRSAGRIGTDSRLVPSTQRQPFLVA